MKIDLYLAERTTGFWTGAFNQPFEKVISYIAENGFDGIELMTGNLKTSNARTIKEIVSSYDLEIVAVASGFIFSQHGLSFTAKDKEVRNSAVELTKRCIEFAQNLGAKIVSIGLIVGQANKMMPLKVAWGYLVESIKECGKFASSKGIILAVEPENRYENGYINTVDDALKLTDRVGLESVQLMLDTFHMNIEETSIYEAIRKASKKLVHMHIADNNRLAPRMGHIDFSQVVRALHDIGYRGYLGLEIDFKPTLESAIKECLPYLRKMIE